MKILFIGDVYAKSGRVALKEQLPKLIKQHEIDFTAINAENASHGKSLEKEHYQEMKELGVQCFTMGNHTFFGGKLEKYIKDTNDILVPHNFNEYNKYTGSKVFKVGRKKVRITSLLGQVFMSPIPSNPFKAMDEILLNDDSNIHILDFHGEATSEKMAFALNYDGKITAQVGTHTHVQTADERILPKGTGFISDLGMTGPRHSVIGADPIAVIKKLKTGKPERFQPATGNYQLMGCIIHIDNRTNRVIKMERVNIAQD